MKDTLNNHSTETDSQSGYEKLIADCEAESEKPLLDRILEDYTQGQFSADIADFILADRDNSELQKALKEAVWWDKNMCGMRRDLVDSFGNEVCKLAAIGREVLKNLYATTEGK